MSLFDLDEPRSIGLRILPEPRPEWPGPCRLGVDCARDESYVWQGRHRRHSRGLQVFQYTLAGAGVFRLGRREWRVEARHGFLCSLADPRTAYYYPCAQTEPWRFVYLIFFGGEKGVRALTQAYGPVLPLPEGSSFLQACARLLSENQAELVLPRHQGLALVNGLFVELLRAQEDRSDSTAGHALVQRTLAYMRENVESPAGSFELARHLGITTEHLCRVFRAELREPPMTYFNRLKARHSAQLLLSENLSGKALAARFGISNAANFSRLFKRYCGVSPAQFKHRAAGGCPWLLFPDI